MCKNHCSAQLIGEIHSSAEKEFYYDNEPSVPDDGTVLEKRAELKNNDVKSIIALGDALSYQMRYNEALKYYLMAEKLSPNSYECHRKCAIRYMSVLRIEESELEFLWCAERTDDKLDIEYRLALCAYYKGDYSGALTKFVECYTHCGNSGEMYIAVLYWHIQCLVRLGKSIDEALKMYRKDVDCGHHIGYMQTVKLFLNGDTGVADKIIGNDELNMCIYRYGYYAYLLYKGNMHKAVSELDDVLRLDTYFSSFAYLGAYCEKRRLREEALKKLKTFFAQNPKVALAFSGGTDSALLLSLAKECGADVKAYFVHSQFQPESEVKDARRLEAELVVQCEFLEMDALDDCDIIKNGKDRCYYCKRKLFSAVKRRALTDGYDVIADGTNASDDLDGRPGFRAIKELEVRSPLLESGLTKADVRYISRQKGLFTWDKPSYSCLATRIASGQPITAEALAKIERAESLLFEMGYVNFRVRYADRYAKIEVDRAQNDKFKEEKQIINESLSDCFDNVEQSEILR